MFLVYTPFQKKKNGTIPRIRDENQRKSGYLSCTHLHTHIHTHTGVPVDEVAVVRKKRPEHKIKIKLQRARSQPTVTRGKMLEKKIKDSKRGCTCTSASWLCTRFKIIGKPQIYICKLQIETQIRSVQMTITPTAAGKKKQQQ